MDTRALAGEMLMAMSQMAKGPINEVQAVSRGEMGVLAYLILKGGSATPTELSQQFAISTPRITNILNGLEKKGLVTRTAQPGDRRKVLGIITEEGRRCSEEVMEGAIACLSRLFEALGEADAKEFVRLSKRVAELNDTVDFIQGLVEPNKMEENRT